jgi:hypothetical protein
MSAPEWYAPYGEPAGQGVIAEGSAVVDLATGATGRVSSLYWGGSAYVVFAGGGRMIQPWEMRLAEGQETGWPQ